MPTDHIKTRQRIKEIANIVDFNEMLDKSTLSEEDKTLIRLHYIEKHLTLESIGFDLITIVSAQDDLYERYKCKLSGII